MRAVRALSRLLVVVALIAAALPAPSLAPGTASAASGPAPQGTVCLPGRDAAHLDTLFDVEPAGVVGADYQRALALPDGRVLWTFQDAAVRRGPDDIVIVHNIAMLQDDTCFTVLYGGTRWSPRPAFFADRTQRYERWFWPLDAAVGDDGRVHVFAAEMEERGADYLTRVVPVGTWVAIFDPATGTVVDETRPPDSSPRLYGWSITSDHRWTYLYAQCFRQFGFDEYAMVAAFDRSCSTEVTVARVRRGRLLDPPAYWDGREWQGDPGRAVSVVDGVGRRINADQFEWTGQRFLSVNKEGDWWGSTILISESTSPTGPFRVADEIAAPVKCAECNSFFASWVPAAAVRSPASSFVISLSHNRWDGVVTSVYRPTFLRVDAPIHLPARSTFELQVDPTASAAAINVVAVGPQRPGYITAYPCADGRPTASNVNYVREPVVSNLVLARPDAAGRICLYSLAETDLVVDLAATFDGVETFRPEVRPRRLVDTRSGRGVPAGRVAAGSVLRFSLPTDLDTGEAAAVALNIVAVDPGAPGYLTAYACGGPRPGTSNVNYGSEPVVSNLVVVPLDGGGDVCVFTLAEVDVVVDIAGVFGAARFVPLATATRLLDTRRDPAARVPRRGVVAVDVPRGSTAALVNVVSVHSSAPGYLTVYPCDETRPGTSNVNYVGVPVVANLVIARPSAEGRVCVFSSAATDVVVDLAGTFTRDATDARVITPVRLVDTRIGVGVPGQLGLR